MPKSVRVPKPFSHPSASDLKEFRAAVSRLKAEGLIPPNSRGKIVSARTARPGDSFGGMSLRDRIKQYKDVASGHAVTIAKSRINDTQGFKVASKGLAGKDRVIIPTQKTSKVSVEKGNIVIRHPGDTAMVKRTMLPRKNLKQYLQAAEDLPDLPKNSNQYYAFYVYNGKSKSIFRSGDQLAEYLKKYGLDNSSDERDFFRTLEIVEISDRGQWEKRSYNTRTVKGHRRKMSEQPASKRELLRAKKREYMRTWRKRQK